METGPVAGKTDSDRSMMGRWFLGYFLVALVVFLGKMYDEHQEQARKQKKVDRQVERHRDSVRRGETGEAFQRLFPEDHRQFKESGKRRPR